MRPVLLALLLTAALPAGAAARDEADFAAFLQRFRGALRAGDAAAVAELTRLPFLFEGRPRDRAAFIRIVPTLFDRPTTGCLLRARPAAEDDARTLACPPYVFYFRRGPDGGYRLEEFAADGEDAR